MLLKKWNMCALMARISRNKSFFLLDIRRHCLFYSYSSSSFYIALCCLLSGEHNEKRVKISVTQQPFSVIPASRQPPTRHILISHEKHIRATQCVRNYFCKLLPWEKNRQMLFWQNFATKFFNELQERHRHHLLEE